MPITSLIGILVLSNSLSSIEKKDTKNFLKYKQNSILFGELPLDMKIQLLNGFNVYLPYSFQKKFVKLHYYVILV